MSNGKEIHNILDSLEIAVIALTKEWTIDYCNEAFSELWEIPTGELKGRELLAFWPEFAGTPTFETCMQVRSTNKVQSTFLEINGRLYSCCLFPTPDGIMMFCEKTEGIRQEKKLRVEGESDFRPIFDELNDAILILDGLVGKILDVNNRACQMFGYSPEEILNLKVADLSSGLPPFTRDGFTSWVRMADSSSQTMKIEWMTRDKEGRLFWVLVRAKNIVVKDQKCLLAVITDITDYKQAQKRLREGAERYRELFDNASDLIYVHDLDGNFITLNRTVEQVTGYWRDELLKMNIEELAARDRLETGRSYLALVRRMAEQKKGKHKPINYEMEIESRQGRRLFLEISSWLIYRSGEPIAIQSIARDITARKLEKAALKDTIKRLTDLVDYLPDPILAIDLDGKVRVWNKAAEELTGVTAENMLGKGNYEYALHLYGERRPLLIDLVLNPEEVEKYYKVIEKNNFTLIGESDVPSLKGEGHYLWGKATRVFDSQGHLVGAVEVIRDITKQQRLEDDLRKQISILEAKLAQMEAAANKI